MISLLNKKLDIFISYARADAADFVSELAMGLEVGGFQPLVDLASISAAEDWKQRIGVLIKQCDTVIAVITPRAVESEIFRWEIEEAARQSKKIVPVEWLATPIAAIPQHLARLNIIFFSTNRSFARGLKTLTEALESDLEWVREHTRLAERAFEWSDQFNRDDNALLVGKQVDEGEAWLARRPANAPAPTPLHLEFISASRRVATERDSAERKRLAEIERMQIARAEALKNLSRRTIQGLIALSGLALVTGAIAYFAYLQKQHIEQAELRLRAGMVLKIADTDHVVYATDKWYRVATDYKLAIGIMSGPLGQPIRQVGTGFLMRGRLLNRDWGDELVFLTAGHVLWGSQPDITQFSATFPALNDLRSLKFSSLAFHSGRGPSGVDVAVLRLSDRPPKGAIPIEVVSTALKGSLNGVAVLHWTQAQGFALGFGHGIAAPKEAAIVRPGQYYYTHVTGIGASGAPVFDADTGDLVCLNQDAVPTGPRPWSSCQSIATIVEAIASNMPAKQ